MKKGVSLVLLVAVVIFGSVCVLAVAGVNHTWSELQKCGADQFAKMNPAGTEWECAIATTSSGGEVVGGFWDKVPSPSDDIYYNDGGVGIGVADDIGYLGLKVQGMAYVTDYLTVENGIHIGGTDGPDGNLLVTDGADLILTGAGKVGIGTAAPEARLTVLAQGDDSGDGDLDIDKWQGAFGASGYGHVLIGTWGNQPSLQGAGGGTDFRLLLNPYSGNVGIGTTNPSSKLDVKGSVRAQGDAVVTGSVSAGSVSSSGLVSSGYGMKIVRDDNYATYSWTGNNGDNVWSLGSVADSYKTYLRYETSNLMTITSTGNVGIGMGTDVPSSKLEVVGDVKSSGLVSSGYGMKVIRDDNYATYFWTGNNGDTEWSLGNVGDSSKTYLRAGTSNLMTITSTGNVGIGMGTASPSEKLDVVGNIKSSGSVSAGSVSTTGAVSAGSVSADTVSTVTLSATNIWYVGGENDASDHKVAFINVGVSSSSLTDLKYCMCGIMRNNGVSQVTIDGLLGSEACMNYGETRCWQAVSTFCISRGYDGGSPVISKVGFDYSFSVLCAD